ncbi:two-component system sensor histidine kinase NtrB [Neorhizobium sp. DT-125]|uniref:two-component system sensor histidine kinase NtrB n=1 Tax=Neorhizobium sp. DT-125 TaxID=3396163 RepID=UPI003F19EF55
MSEITDLNSRRGKRRGSAEGASLAGIPQPSFQKLIETTADGVLVVDRSGAVLYANPAASEIFGHSREELLHVPLGRPVTSGETTTITVHRPGREAAEVEMRVVEVTWDGEAALLASLRDVSARRAHEARLRQAQRLEAVGRLAAGIIHDLNNLLAAFGGGLRLLRKQLGSENADPKAAILIEELLRRTENGGALTQQLLAFSRRQELSPENVDLNARLDSLTGLIERTLGRDIELRCVFEPSVGNVQIDANQLDVAILNLAVNARHAMKDAGTLTIETAHAQSNVADFPSGETGFARVTVRDTGCGMNKDVLAQVFEPFFTTKSEGEGTGLGLSQVYGFVTQSEGHIHIDSEVGAGTSVHLFLPKAPSAVS